MSYLDSYDCTRGSVQHLDHMAAGATAQLAQVLQLVNVRPVFYTFHIQLATHL